MYRNYILPASLLAGTIIGAGIFSLPLAMKTAGVALGFFYLAVATVVYVFLHLMYADVILRTDGSHEFVGYVRRYLGEGSALFTTFIAVIETVVVLTIYLILSVSFSNLFIVSGSDTLKLLIFWALGSVTIFSSIKRIASVEFLITVGILLVIGLIFSFGLPKFGQVTFFDGLPPFANLLFPLAPIFFALSGRVAVASLVNYFGGQGEAPRFIKRSVVIGTIVPAIVYGLFVLGVLAISPNPSEDSIAGLVGHIPAWSLPVIGFLGLISLWSSYVPSGLSVLNILRYDFKLPFLVRLLIIVGAPLTLYFGGFTGFLALIGLVGGIFLALEGIIIVLMWMAARKKSVRPPVLFRSLRTPIIGFLFTVLVIVLVYEIIKIQ